MRRFNNVNELVNELKPSNPVYCIRPESIKKACSWFIKNFPGKTLYAVKTNPNETVIKEIKDSQIILFKILGPPEKYILSSGLLKILGILFIIPINPKVLLNEKNHSLVLVARIALKKSKKISVFNRKKTK